MVANQPLTIGIVRDQHLGLLREWRDLASDKQRLERAAALRDAVAEAGKDIELPAERDEAQGIIDYWASACAALPKQSYPKLVAVAEYQGARATVAARSIRDVYQALTPPEAQRLARSIMEDLLVLTATGVGRGRPRERETLRTNAGAQDPAQFDAVLAQLVETGAIALRPGEDSDGDRFEVADARITDAWPDLKDWLGTAAAYTDGRAQLMELARKWSAANRDPAMLLLTTSAVDQALPFKNEDDLLDSYIDASHKARTFWRRISLVLASVAIVGLSIAIVVLVWKYREAGKDGEKATFDRDQAIEERNQAKLAKLNIETELVNLRRLVDAAKIDARLAGNNPQFEAELLKSTAAISSASGAESENAVSQLQIVSGAMWLGNDDTPQVSDLRGGRVGKLADASTGARLRVRMPTYLRVAMPRSDIDYASPTAKAVVPAGGQIVLLGSPRAYKRQTGIQYWANVRIVPQVYVQYNNAPKQEIDRIREELAKAGFEAPPAQRIGTFQGLSEVRYLRPGDREIAVLLQQQLDGLPQVRARGAVGCQLVSVTSSTPTNFKLEFWFDPQRQPGTRTATRCP